MAKNMTIKPIGSYPTSWDQIIREGLEIDCDIGSGEEDREREDFMADIQDPLGLLGVSTPQETLQQLKGDLRLDWKSENFKPREYLAVIQQQAALLDLQVGREHLEAKLRDKQGQLKKLVNDHFHRFVGCQATINQLNKKIHENNKFEIDHLNLHSTMTNSKNVAIDHFDDLLENKDTIQNMQDKLGLLTHFKFRFMINLPKVMRADMDSKEYGKVTLHYLQIKRVLFNTESTMFRQVLYSAQGIISELRAILFAQLADDSLSRKSQEETIRLLLMAGEGEDIEDPAWFCLKLRYQRLSRLLSKLSLGENATEAVRSMSRAMLGLLPDFWGMAYAFYHGDYHKDTCTHQQILDIWEKYPESNFDQFMQEITRLYCSGVWSKFYRGQSEYMDFLTGMPSQPHISRRKQGFRASNFAMSGGDLSPHHRKRRAMQQDGSVPEDEPLITEEQREDEKDQVEAVYTVVDLVKKLKISFTYVGKIFSLHEHITKTFLTTTFQEVLEAVKKIHLEETWEIHDRSYMVTSLPNLFADIMGTLLNEFSHLAEVKDPQILELIEDNFFECLQSFADNIHHLAFHTKKTAISQEAKFLILLNNCIFVRNNVVPRLLEAYALEFKGNLDHPKNQGAVVDCLCELEGMILNRYIKLKAIPLSKLVKYGLLQDGEDWTKTSPNSGIRDYMMSIILSLVYVHEEVNRMLCSQQLRETILFRCIESVYQTFLDWIQNVDHFSSEGRLQLGMEVTFFSTILNPGFEKSTMDTLKKVDQLAARLESIIQFEALNQANKKQAFSQIHKTTKNSSLLFGCFSHKQ